MRPSTLLLIHPGASYSTADVYTGYFDALTRAGVRCIPFQLDTRLDRSARWLLYNWRQECKAGHQRVKPTSADIVYRAGVDALERALRFDVEWVLIVSGMYLHPDIVTMLGRAGRRIALLLTESPYDDEAQVKLLPAVDLAWTNERSSAAPLAEASGTPVGYLPPAYDPARHGPDLPLDPDAPAHDVVFVGTAFQERIELLSAVDWTGIDLGLYGEWRALPSRHRLRRYVRGGITDNARAAALYRRAKIGLNLYRQTKGFGRHQPRISYAASLNPRAVELAASGCFSIQEGRAEVLETFGQAAVTFATPDDLSWQIRHYLAADDERRAIAALHRQAIAGWTFDARAEHLLSDLERMGAQTPLAAAV